MKLCKLSAMYRPPPALPPDKLRLPPPAAVRLTAPESVLPSSTRELTAITHNSRPPDPVHAFSLTLISPQKIALTIRMATAPLSPLRPPVAQVPELSTRERRRELHYSIFV